MRLSSVGSLLAASFVLAACHGATAPSRVVTVPAPRAEVRPVELEKHGDVRVDPYHWLNQREDPDVLAYLSAENAHTDAAMAHTRRLQSELFDEMKGRIKKNDATVPYRLAGFWYYTRYEKGKEYAIYCRKQGSLDAPEQVMLDANELAVGQPFLSVRGVTVSSGKDVLAYAVDNVGRRIYTIRFRDLATGATLTDEIADVTGNLAWAEDGRTLYYTKQDPETLRAYQVWRHVVGTDPASDALVYQEDDETFSVSVWKTRSRKYLMVGSFQTLSTEIRYVDAAYPDRPLEVFAPRERDHEYEIDHIGEHFYVRTNRDARNFRLMRTPVGNTDEQSWDEVIPHRDDVFLEEVDLFDGHLVLTERKDGLIRLRVRPWSGDGEHYLDFGEPAYLAYVDNNPELDSTVLRYGYTSMTTPNSIYDYDMTTRRRELKKQDEVLGGFDAADYVTERLHATARDGTSVPISLVYRKGPEPTADRPLVVYGYGSYGASIDPTFSAERLSLLDRGFVFAIAHIRGGQELGRRWYDDGKLLRKVNTFTDFIDCTEHLTREGRGDPDRVFAIGGSAGGLLVGAVINMRPELYRGVVARVPFVDVVTTMLDDSIPLTTGEYDEWGNPNDKTYYDYMLSYSPYDNVAPRSYPHMLVTAGLHDSQVQYWEPAKWVAKLRAMKTDDHKLLLHTEMEAGHGGKSGRFRRYEETALIYAFLLDLARPTGLGHTEPGKPVLAAD
jgi:oligopeptidase B